MRVEKQPDATALLEETVHTIRKWQQDGYETKVKENARQYDKSSPLLCGTLTQYDKITDRKIKSLKDGQFSLFRE